MTKLVNLLFVVLFSTLLFNCSKAQNNNNSSNSKTKLEVYYFHATNRCPTCNAVENNAKKLLEEKYKEQLENKTIKFTSINIDDDVNKALVEKYEISFSTLLIINKSGTKEIVKDFTDIAFQYARTNPEKYANLLAEELNNNLK